MNTRGLPLEHARAHVPFTLSQLLGLLAVAFAAGLFLGAIISSEYVNQTVTKNQIVP